MLSNESLHTLFRLKPALHAPNLTIYAVESNPRLTYVCEFIFNHVLKLNYTLQTDVTEFNNTQGLKINYSATSFSDCLQIFPSGLLSQTGVSEEKPKSSIKNNWIYFYETNDLKVNSENTYHFDIFSAVFYQIARYEEWQHFTADTHLRFEASQSNLYQANWHLKPVVDHWIIELKTALQKQSATYKFPQTTFQVISTIDVDNLYAFKYKGLFRTWGASIKDLLRGDFFNIRLRFQVLKGKQPDPFDIYESVSDFCFEKKIPLIYFFLFKTGDTYNRTVDPSTGAFLKVFNILKKNKALIGIHPSYDAAYDVNKLQKEIKDFRLQSVEKVNLSRQHYLRFDIRNTPIYLIENGINFDFTMGYASEAGFRAGTSHPFYYYDFRKEQRTELLFIPFCVMDGAYTVYGKNDTDSAYRQIMELADEIRKVNGIFISVFHERSFYDHLYPAFGTLYKKLHEDLREE